MTSRERIIARATGNDADRVPFVIQWGPWDDTRRRWRAEGMRNDDDWHSLFGFDVFKSVTGVNFGPCPAFEREVLADEGDTIIYRDEQGVIKRDRKAHTTMPEFLEFPVRDRKTWNEHKWRFDASTPERFPDDWSERSRALSENEALVTVGTYPYGFLGGPRTMMGVEACLIAMALEPELIEEISEHFCRMWLSIWGRVFEETRVDCIAFWEDMAGKQGSLISPDMFRRFLTPYYRRLVELGERHGVKLFSVDSDGFMHELTGLFIEAGVNVIYPYEMQAGNDVALLLERYSDFCPMGGMDKRVMARDRAAIDIEMERVAALVELKRYIPFPDHLIPADVSWESYQYFVWRWRELTGKKD